MTLALAQHVYFNFSQLITPSQDFGLVDSKQGLKGLEPHCVVPDQYQNLLILIAFQHLFLCLKIISKKPSTNGSLFYQNRILETSFEYLLIVVKINHFSGLGRYLTLLILGLFSKKIFILENWNCSGSYLKESTSTNE